MEPSWRTNWSRNISVCFFFFFFSVCLNKRIKIANKRKRSSFKSCEQTLVVSEATLVHFRKEFFFFK